MTPEDAAATAMQDPMEEDPMGENPMAGDGELPPEEEEMAPEADSGEMMAQLAQLQDLIDDLSAELGGEEEMPEEEFGEEGEEEEFGGEEEEFESEEDSEGEEGLEDEAEDGVEFVDDESGKPAVGKPKPKKDKK